MKTINDLVKEFYALRGMHLCELTDYFKSKCSCDWCAYIVDELFYENFEIRLSRSCTQTRYILKNNSDFTEVNRNNLKVGDVILYDWDNSGDCDHIGIVSRIVNGVPYVLEGNVGSTDFTKSTVNEMCYDDYRKSHTNCVFRYSRNENKMIFHEVKATITLTECDIEHGHKADKLIAQALLYNYGYYTGLLDGIFGEKTINAIKRFQANHQINTTGVIECETWKILIDLI